MYYIVNETNQLIAADETLLSLCGVAHIDALASKIIKNDINFTLADETITLSLENREENFAIRKTYLSSLLGHLQLIEILTEEEQISPLEEEEDTALIDSILNEESENPEEEIMPLLSDDLVSELEETDITFGDHLALDEDIITLKEPEETKEKEEIELFDLLEEEENSDVSNIESEKNLSDTDAPLALDIDTNDEIAIKEENTLSEINIDIIKISKSIGISTEDYNTFLNEFIDTALRLEKDLQSNDKIECIDAIDTLSNLSDVLHIPVIGDILSHIEDASEGEQPKLVESFYTTLSQITTTQKDTDDTLISENKPEKMEEEILQLLDEPTPDPLIQKEVVGPKTSSGTSFGSISLEGIQPKHFDFQLEAAANDLSLPIELIEEFVHDFIEQAHIETKKMLQAYEEGDLDTIQKIGHLLKGASSNLRITPLSDTLYNIQFCEDTTKLEVLIKDYWAHFLAFENQIKTLSN